MKKQYEFLYFFMILEALRAIFSFVPLPSLYHLFRLLSTDSVSQHLANKDISDLLALISDDSRSQLLFHLYFLLIFLLYLTEGHNVSNRGQCSFIILFIVVSFLPLHICEYLKVYKLICWCLALIYNQKLAYLNVKIYNY